MTESRGGNRSKPKIITKIRTEPDTENISRPVIERKAGAEDETETETKTQIETETDRDRDRDRGKDKDKDGNRDKPEIETQRHKHRQTDKHQHTAQNTTYNTRQKDTTQLIHSTPKTRTHKDTEKKTD